MLKILANLVNVKRETEKSEFQKSNYIHEAGHVLMAYKQGFRFFLHITDEAPNIFLVEDVITAERLRSLILVKLAGLAAEDGLGGVSRKSRGIPETDSSDIYVATKYTQRYIFMTRPDLAKYPDDPAVNELTYKLSKEYFDEAQILSIKNQVVIRELATEFAKKQDWEYEEIENFMKLRGISPSKNGTSSLTTQI